MQQYSILKNGSGDLMLMMAKQEGNLDKDNVKLMYKGGADAYLVRGESNVIPLNSIHQEIRRDLYSADSITVVETENGQVIEEYNAPVVNT